MRVRPNPAEALATLVRHTDEAERRANWRQAVTALGQSAGASGPPPLDGIATEVLSRVIQLALDSGLVDDLNWIADGPAAVALYEITAALPQGRPRRELARRVFGRLYEGNATTFATVAARMALTSTRSLEAATLRARIGLVFDMPVGSAVNADALALTLVTRRELRDRWLERAKTGTLPARRLAAKLIEHAAREAVTRAQQGDQHPQELLLSEPIKSTYLTLLADREPLVWRHAAVARGLLSAANAELRQEIDLTLDPALSPTEWRRAAVSLVATLASEPENSLRACRRVLQGPLAERDGGIAATMVLGLPRVIEAEPDAAEALLDLLSAKRRTDVAEAVAALLGDLNQTSFGSRAAQLLRATLVSAEGQTGVLRGVAERAIRILERDQDEDNEVEGAVRRALVAYETKGARAAHELAVNALAAAHRAMDFIGTHEAGDDQMLPYVLGSLVDLDAGALETSRLNDLMLLNRKPGDADATVPEIDRLYDRLGGFLLAAEAGANQAEGSQRAATGEQRRLKVLLHLVDIEGAKSEDDSGVRARVQRAVQVMLRRLAAKPDPSVHRIACATLARSFDAAIREGVCEPSDLLLALVSEIDDLGMLQTIGEASTNPDFCLAVTAYANFINPAGDTDAQHEGQNFEAQSLRNVPDEAARVAARVLKLSRGLGSAGGYRGEALRRVVQRLGRMLEAVASARGQTELVDSGSGTDILGEIESSVDALARLIAGAKRRVFQEDPMTIAVVADVPSIAALVERTVRSGVPPNEAQLSMALTELTADLPKAIGNAISAVLGRIGTLPVAAVSDVYAIPLEKRRAALPDWLLPRRTIGAFYVVRALGSGGAASVFMARRIEERNNTKAESFALKVPAFDPTTARSISEQEFLQLFREEAGALLGLAQHPNLSRFVTFDLAARPKPILVMELIGGVGLDRLVRSRSLSADRVVPILDGILAGLEAMHTAGVGHLDIKPSNVILRDGETPVLVDFGLSGRHLRPGCGTLEYCSPEVLGICPEGHQPSPLPADMYAFACTAYEALTADLLFDGEDEMAIMSAHVDHDGWPPRLAKFVRAPKCKEIATLLAACLRRDPRLRPTVEQARRALAKAGAGLKDAAWPLGGSARTEMSA
jgi:eukaryotic-like serine/threonine-protein kinase